MWNMNITLALIWNNQIYCYCCYYGSLNFTQNLEEKKKGTLLSPNNLHDWFYIIISDLIPPSFWNSDLQNTKYHLQIMKMLYCPSAPAPEIRPSILSPSFWTVVVGCLHIGHIIKLICVNGCWWYCWMR